MDIRKCFLFAALTVFLTFSTGCIGPLYVIYEFFLKEDPVEETNAPPAVSMGLVGRTYDAASIPVDFTLADPEGDSCRVSVYYSVGGGAWKPCTGVTGVSGRLQAPKSGKQYSGTWDAAADLGTGTTSNVKLSIIADDGDDTSRRSVSDTFISGNNAPSVTVTQPASIEAGNIIIEYTVSDPASDNVSLVCEYSTDGINYSGMNIAAGEISNITTSSGGESHTIVWGSNNDIPGVNEGTVWVKIQASDGAPASGEDTTDSSFQVHNNASTPIAVITQFDRSFPADVRIDYKLVDTDGGTGSITPKYSTDGTNWIDAAEKTGGASEGTTNLSMSADGDMHVYVWDSAVDIGTGLKTGIYFKVIPNDGGGPGVAGEVGPFSIGNDAPAADITDPSSPQSGNIVINYTLTDSTDDDCTVTFQYGESPTGPWSAATPAIGTNPEPGVTATTGGSGHTYVWDSSTDYTNASATVYVNIIAEDGGALTGEHVSAGFTVDNTSGNSAPVVVISTISRQFDASNIPINFNLSDAENNPCDITVYYQVGGGGWNLCTGITGDTTALNAPPGGWDHSVTWDATGNIGSATVLDVEVSIIANDGTVDSQRGESNTFISGNHAPTVSIVDPGAGQGGNIVIDYTLSDPASDPCTVTVQYQIDGEADWYDCESASIIPNPQTGVASAAAGIDYSFMWESETDLGAVVVDVWVRVKADDAAPSTGFGVTTTAFNVDNVTANDPPSVTFLSSLMVLNDNYAIIPIPYQIYDPEQDICSLILEYSTDGGANWHPCTEYPEKCSDGRTGLSSYKNTGEEKLGQHLFLWNSINDVGWDDVLCDLRIAAKDALLNQSQYVFKSIISTNFSSVAPVNGGTITAGDTPTALATGDINGDGYKDIACANANSLNVTVSYGSISGHSAPITVGVGNTPSDIAMGDINGDGFADIVVTNRGWDDISVCYGSSSGPGSDQRFDAGILPWSIKTCDINGDGYDDIVCANRNSDDITISYGSASGHTTPQTVLVGEDPDLVSAGDINADGFDDVCFVHYTLGEITVLYGSISGHGSPQTISAGVKPCDISVGDINGDGYDDIACCNETSDDITVSYGSGTGHGAPQTITAGDHPRLIGIGDINGDIFGDIICTNQFDESITISYGNSSGHGLPVTLDTTSVGIGASMALGDINEDGFDEMVFVCDSGYLALIYCGEDGFNPIKSISLGDLATQVMLSDINSDGKKDIITINGASDTLSVAYGKILGVSSTLTFATGVRPRGVTMGDVNGDGFQDIVCANEDSDTMTISYGNPLGHSTPQNIISGIDPVCIAIGDIDRDGYGDIVCSNDSDANLTICYGSDTGHTAPVSLAVGLGQNGLTLGDIDGDGFDDIVCTNQWDDTMTISYGSGTGHGPPQTILTGDQPRAITTGDINGDGYDDIACVNYFSDELTISYGSGTGHGSPQTISAGTHPCSLTIGDVNGDGYGDIVCAGEMSEDIRVSYGSNTGHTTPKVCLVPGFPLSISVGDVNGDGYDDIACCHYTTDALTIVYGTMHGQSSLQTLSVGVKPHFVDIKDINGDGYADIMCVNRDSDNISISYGSVCGHTAPTTFTVGEWPSSLAVGDINGDGHLDIACSNWDSDNITVGLGETSCKGLVKEVDTSAGDFTVSYKNLSAVFPINSFLAKKETTLWTSSTSIKIPHPSIGTTWQKPIKASFPMDLMPFDTQLETGKSVTMTIHFLPNVSDERIKWADFRLYRYGWGVDKYDPRDDVVEIIATTEFGIETLTIDPDKRTATTDGTNLSKFGKFQLFQVTEDSDNDGIPDAWETYYSETDPGADTDGGVGDGLTNLEEYQYECNPGNVDTDGDTYEDGWEVTNGYDPADRKSHP